MQKPIASEPLVGEEVEHDIAWSVEPRRINLSVRMSRVRKTQLENMQDKYDYVSLYDYDQSFVDYVWITDTEFDWRGDENHEYPWLTTVGLVCSSL